MYLRSLAGEFLVLRDELPPVVDILIHSIKHLGDLMSPSKHVRGDCSECLSLLPGSK